MMVTRSSGEATIGTEEVVVFKENILSIWEHSTTTNLEDWPITIR